MSFSAFVLCNCYQNGKTIKPPYEKHVKFDKYGLQLDPPLSYSKNQDKVNQMHLEFDNWLATACPHKDMELVYEHLCNNGAMAKLKRICREIEEGEKFSILSEFLPNFHGGILPAEFAQKAFKELITLEKIEYPEKGISLISKHNKSVMASCRMDSHSIFVLTAGNAYHYGIDKNGFFILEKRKENDLENFYVVFRSKNFIQSYIRENMFQFTDIATIFHFECSVSLEFNEDNPTELYEFIIQESEIDQISNFSILIAKLKKLAKASMKTGNPIHWT